MSSRQPYAEIQAAFADADTRALPDQLDPSQREELRAFWIGRASGELTTALSFEFMLEDLRTLAAPDVLLELARAAIADEHRHVDWCLRFAALLGDGQPANAELGGTRPAEFEGASQADNRVLRTVFGGCFSETAAVQVLLASQSELELESVSRLNRQHVAEEVQHARLGWGFLAWPGLRARDRAMLADFAPALAARVRALWLGPDRPADATLQALGYLSAPLVEKALDRAFDEVIWPGLERNGVRV